MAVKVDLCKKEIDNFPGIGGNPGPFDMDQSGVFTRKSTLHACLEASQLAGARQQE